MEIFLLALAARSPLARYFRSFADEARLDELVIASLNLMQDSLVPFTNKSPLELQMMPANVQKQVEELKEMKEIVGETSSTYFPSNPLKLDVILNRNRQAALIYDDVFAAVQRSYFSSFDDLCFRVESQNFFCFFQTDHCEGTCSAVISAFDKFLQLPDSSTQRVFWIHGGAGTGKSVAMAQLVKKFAAQSPDMALFWCKHDSSNGSGSLTLFTLVLSITIFQLHIVLLFCFSQMRYSSSKHWH
jgi:hypothetical protein